LGGENGFEGREGGKKRRVFPYWKEKNDNEGKEKRHPFQSGGPSKGWNQNREIDRGKKNPGKVGEEKGGFFRRPGKRAIFREKGARRRGLSTAKKREAMSPSWKGGAPGGRAREKGPAAGANPNGRKYHSKKKGTEVEWTKYRKNPLISEKKEGGCNENRKRKVLRSSKEKNPKTGWGMNGGRAQKKKKSPKIQEKKKKKGTLQGEKRSCAR